MDRGAIWAALERDNNFVERLGVDPLLKGYSFPRDDLLENGLIKEHCVERALLYSKEWK